MICPWFVNFNCLCVLKRVATFRRASFQEVNLFGKKICKPKNKGRYFVSCPRRHKPVVTPLLTTLFRKQHVLAMRDDPHNLPKETLLKPWFLLLLTCLATPCFEIATFCGNMQWSSFLAKSDVLNRNAYYCCFVMPTFWKQHNLAMSCASITLKTRQKTT